MKNIKIINGKVKLSKILIWDPTKTKIPLNLTKKSLKILKILKLFLSKDSLIESFNNMFYNLHGIFSKFHCSFLTKNK